MGGVALKNCCLAREFRRPRRLLRRAKKSYQKRIVKRAIHYFLWWGRNYEAMEKWSYLWYDFEPSRVQKNPANLKSDSFPKQLKKKLVTPPAPCLTIAIKAFHENWTSHPPETRNILRIFQPQSSSVFSTLYSTVFSSLAVLLCSFSLLCPSYQSNAAIRTTPVSQKKKDWATQSTLAITIYRFYFL